MRLPALSGSRLSAFAFEEAGLRGSGWASWESRDCRGPLLFCVLGRLPLLLSFRRRNLRGLTAACAPVALGLGQMPCVCFDFGSTANIFVAGNGIRRPLQ